MIVTPTALKALMVGFKKNYQDGLAEAESHYKKIATVIPGTGKSTTYGWLGKWPSFREWVGDRVFKSLAAHAYSIVNKKFESSVEVERDEIEDDEIGVYAPMFTEMGRAAAEHPDTMIFGLLKNGFAETCFDGQNYFDTDHPVYAEVDGTGAVTTVSNMQDGALTPWFMLDTSRSLKPLIYQERRKMEFKAMTDATNSESAWLRDAYQYGVDGRNNAGFGFWQMAFGSKAEPTIANIRAAHAAMEAFKGDGGKVLNVKPKMIVCGTALREKFEDILDKQYLANGESNPLYKKYELLVTAYLD